MQNEAENNLNQQSASEQSVPEPPKQLETDKDAKMWGTFCHLSAVSGFVGVPFGWILGPLIIWLIKKDEIDFVNEEGKEALNFQLTVLIGFAIGAVTTCIGIGVFILVGVAIMDLIFIFIASVKVNTGQHYKYPINIRFFK